MAYCNKCGGQIDEDNTFCSNCGTQVKKREKNIKMVPAKCPSCGSNLEVDPNKTRTKCEYCKTTVLIEDAIKKLKIEISGEVEIKNLPNINNLIKNANRNYENRDYNKALNNYTAALDLDPDNSFALLREGICKFKLNNNLDFLPLFQGLKYATKAEKNDDKKKEIVNEAINEVAYINNQTITNFLNLKIVYYKNIEIFIARLNMCNDAWEKMIQYVTSNDLLSICCKFIVNNVCEMLYSRKYISQQNSNEKRYYYPNLERKKILIEKGNRFINILKQINLTDGEACENKLNEATNSTILQFLLNIPKEIFIIIYIIIFVMLIILING